MLRLELGSGACIAAMAAAFPCGQAAAQQSNPYKPERFDEDWRLIETDDVLLGDWKDIDVAGASISIGGDARWRAAWLDSPRLGIGGVGEDEWLSQRFLLHADMRFEDVARIFLQFGAHDTMGRELPSTSDDNQFAITQAFVDLNTQIGDARATLRVGRQELALGSPRFVTTRDNANVRQRHDLVRLILSNGPWRADLFGGAPTHDDRGVFDDEADPDQRFYGARVMRSFGALQAEAAVFNLDRASVSLAGITAPDDRWSLSTRIGGRMGDYDLDAEAMAQWGAFGGQEIEAFGVFADIGRRFDDAPWRPRIGARVTYGSGDRDLTDDKQQTFAPPFPQASWFGQNGLASFSNTAEIAGTLGLSPRDDVSVTMKLSSLWRADTADFLYTAAGPLAGTSGGEAFIGTGANLGVVWRASQNVTLGGYVSYLDASDTVHDFGGSDVAYAHMILSLRF